MPEHQLRLFEAPKPLLHRLGKEFFAAAPRGPGVYIMTDGCERVLYIGQSKNLRARLGSYKNARLDGAPRKVVRLVHEVECISWEACESAEAARLRESELLLLHRPKFNRVGTWPKAQRFVCLREDPTAIELRLSPVGVSGADSFGPFPAGAVEAFRALVRLLWAAWQRPESLDGYPAGLLGPVIRPKLRLNFDRCPPALNGAEWVRALRAYLSAESEGLVRVFESVLQPAQTSLCFFKALHLQDLETLALFFRSRLASNPVRALK